MKASERFLEYVQVYTTSDYESGQSPSTARQFDLAKKLKEEMDALGISGAFVDDKCYVYGWIPATPGYENVPPLGFIAHMDTAPDCSGENVKPLLHENYDGGNVTLPGGHVIEAGKFPELQAMRGQTLITASGNTLLGADDKAGIAEIMTGCERVLKEGIPHGRLCIAFTPDEEIGHGADHFDVDGFGAKYAYTVDGGPVNEIEYESFNAASARLVFIGVDSHPGAAKGIMVNAARLAMELDSLLPEAERPEKTSGREGFFHLCAITGNVGMAQSDYIIRDHDRTRFEQRKQQMEQAVQELGRRYGAGCVQLHIEDSYYNMGEVVLQHFHLVENAKKAVEMVGLEPRTCPIRGGTDGSRLSFMGLPCPNLGTGGALFHGLSECITVEVMDKAVEIMLDIIGIYAKQYQ